MAKYFLGSVGKAEAFRMNADGKMELMFVSKTLTDSGLNISTTKDDIRGGQGAPIQFSFYHDASVEITLTDIQFKTDYVTAQLGAEFVEHPESYITIEVQSNGEEYDLKAHGKSEVLPLPVTCGKEEQYVVWAAKKGSDEFRVYEAQGSKITLPEGTYCVRYLAADARAKVAEITSNIIPSELFLIITAPIFAGDACAASRGKEAGHITFEVPRFLLNGGQEFAMNMSSNQTMSLAGTALASESADCEAMGGKLLRIIEVINDRKWFDNIKSIAVIGEVGEKPEIYGIDLDDHVVAGVIDKNVTFAPVLGAGGLLEAKEYAITLVAGEKTLTTTLDLSQE